MAYVDGFLIPLKKDRLEAYKDLARLGGEVWMGHGALSYVECIGDDVPVGALTSFPRAVLLEEDEIVVFSWITYASRAERDRIMQLVMADPRLQHMMDPANHVFDSKRMIFGGFERFLEL
jgi:uncharacterized protein YbaA (DUF1428 family)